MSSEPDPTLTGQFRLSRGGLILVTASVTLLTFTLLLLPTDKVAESIGRLQWSLFLMLLVLFPVSHLAAAAKWWFLLGRQIRLVSAVRGAIRA